MPPNTALQYQLNNIRKVYHAASEDITVLDGISLDICCGEQIAVVGASGSGKSTLLHLLGTLDTPTEGILLFNGLNTAEMSDADKARIRREHIGFVFQSHCLLPEFNTMENAAMQAIIAGVPRDEALAAAEKALERVGLAHRASYKVAALSGGERQRTAIARAILRSPSVLLADEPTGNLDEKNAASIAELLLELNHASSMTLVMVTHNADMALAMNRRLELKAGALYEKNY